MCGMPAATALLKRPPPQRPHGNVALLQGPHLSLRSAGSTRQLGALYPLVLRWHRLLYVAGLRMGRALLFAHFALLLEVQPAEEGSARRLYPMTHAGSRHRRRRERRRRQQVACLGLRGRSPLRLHSDSYNVEKFPGPASSPIRFGGTAACAAGRWGSATCPKRQKSDQTCPMLRGPARVPMGPATLHS